MKVIVNDVAREVPAGTTLAGLLRFLGAEHRGLAVELDGRVVPPSELARLELQPEARIELVRVVGGG